MENSVAATVLLITADDALLDHALAVCAAADVEPEVTADAGAARGRWSAAALVVVGADLAGAVALLGLPRRTGVLLLDLVDRADGGLAAASLRLGAPVVVLPGGAADLVAAVAAVADRAPSGCRVLAVVGGTGGIGASTLATGLALVAARSGRPALLVDLDPVGGGLDLLVGAERTPGWRWPQLSGARGQLGDLRGQLPNVDGVDLIAAARSPETDRPPGAAAVAAVVGSGRRSHSVVVLDIGRTNADARAAVALADVTLLLVGAGIRGVAAGRQLHARLRDGCDRWWLVARRPRTGGLHPDDAAEGFDPPLLGVLEDDPALAVAADRGEPPARTSRSPLARLCRQILDTVVDHPEVAA